MAGSILRSRSTAFPGRSPHPLTGIFQALEMPVFFDLYQAPDDTTDSRHTHLLPGL